MQKYLTIDINVILFLILLMVITVIYQKQRYRSYTTRLFLALCWLTAGNLVLDIFPWILDGIPGPKIRPWVIGVNYLQFLVQPLPIIAWVCYLDYQVIGSMERLKKRWFYLQPLLLVVLFLAINAGTGIFFRINPENQYRRGPLVFLLFAVNYGIVFYSFYLVFRHRYIVERRTLRIITLFGGTPLIGASLQILFYGVNLVWPSVALAVIFVYIFLETQREIRDYLTGLLNRQQMDDFLKTRIGDYRKRGAFALVMIDMDGFKEINDRYGHKEGDRALIQVASLLMRSVKMIDKVSRFGGDEFLILLEAERVSSAESVIRRIQDTLAKDNRRQKERPYPLRFSAGYMIYDPVQHPNVKELLNAADQAMYREKRRRKTKK